MTSCHVLLFLALFVFSANADVSIDCGASESYTDENSITWRGDDDIFQSSFSEVVQSSNTVSHVMSTLRVFTSRKKNCYFISVDKGPLLVRASFYYGNYDRKLSPPSFDLLIDGNHWTKVITSLDKLLYYEVVYVVESDATTICLAQTQPNQFPFISALEVRSLDPKMYSYVDPKYALFVRSRFAYGASATVRYPDDVYDRIWVPESGDKKTAIYMNLYFSEVTDLDTTQKRSFRIYIDNNPKSEPIIPPYGKVTEMLINYTASSNTSFSLVSTLDSTLPPLINAMEVFSVSDPLVVGTNSKDVGGLVELQTQFSVLQGWYGDPCLPSPYTWDWISCSNDVIPHVTALDLSSFGLSGQLPDFSSMDSLVTIDLHNNSFSGPIPDFLGAFPYLEELNLADNSFSGPIPPSISSNKTLKLVVSGNPGLCVSGKSCKPTSTDGTKSSPTPSSSSKKSSKLPLILGTTIPSFMIFWAIVAFILHYRRKKAAIAAITAGKAAGSNMPSQGQGSPGNVMMGKMGEAAANEGN
ncbi:hypothetical protein POPTR_013G030100v4 [Populus trichocarpa]|uniref:Cytochrome b5 heme-binding domain-containing protein n=1 Tax=Populus trichocarpa TaxID=3694 RepID=A0A2K1Y069_POPTR|nr:hypothetical protein POPTR_013G030100v4 [Populus trichocarpa]